MIIVINCFLPTLQVKELGVAIYNCSRLAQDLHKIFQSYWVMGASNSSLPEPWPAKYDTDISKDRPLLVEAGNVSSTIYLSVSSLSFTSSLHTVDHLQRSECECQLHSQPSIINHV